MLLTEMENLQSSDLLVISEGRCFTAFVLVLGHEYDHQRKRLIVLIKCPDDDSDPAFYWKLPISVDSCVNVQLLFRRST